jgi:glycerate kinase
MEGFDAAVAALPLTVMCDIDNPLCGPLGAAAVFAPQKGADSAMVQMLDDGLRHLSEVINRDIGMDVLAIPGGGAAGGFGAGAASILGGTLRSGIDAVLSAAQFESHLMDTDLIITGEGKLDSQSLRGKVVIGVAQRAKAMGKPVIAIVGGAEDAQVAEAYDMGVTAVFPINRLPQDFSVSRHHSEENLKYTADNIMRLLAAEQRRAKK